MKYYLDTCIWIDFIENRYDGLNPIGEYAFLFLKKCEKHKDTIFYSQHILIELEQYKYSLFDFINCFTINFKEIKFTTKEVLDSNDLSKKLKMPRGDALHSILAKSRGAVVITRDKHFEKIKIVKSNKPEELI